MIPTTSVFHEWLGPIAHEVPSIYIFSESANETLSLAC